MTNKKRKAPVRAARSNAGRVRSKGMKVYFTDWFDIEPKVLEKYGAFNVSLINDLPLFIDPFLLFTSRKKRYAKLHDDIISYLKFLRDQSTSRPIDSGLLKAWYCFPEVKQLWLGFSLRGNAGSGLGMDFAKALHTNLNVIFTDFGSEKITKGSHLEKVCLIQNGVGRDNISDFTANLIKPHLLEYTQTFCQKHLQKSQRRIVNVPNVSFDYKHRVWVSAKYELPFIDNDYVLLTPRDMLTKDDNWINRHELFDRFEEIVQAVEDDTLRATINEYLLRKLKPDASEEKRDSIYQEVIAKYPTLLEWYIRSKERTGDQAVKQSEQRVTESEARFIKEFGEFIDKLSKTTGFYKLGTDTFEEARQRLEFLKEEIENNGGYKILYHKDKAIQREQDLQLLYRLTWYATPSDFNSEVNNGRGPVDFKISRGSGDKTIVEFKLAKNSKLRQNLENQVKIYEKANRTNKSLKAIFYFTVAELEKVKGVLSDLKLDEDDTIYLIDCRADNKPSASNVK